ncbi:MAG: ABC transporter ATP-binding protein [Nitriliruptoraceae bacterium]
MATDRGTVPLLAVRGLAVDYVADGGVRRALDGVDLDVMPGTTVALVGTSGSGKTTLLHAVLGLLAADARRVAGSIDFAGEELTALDAETRRQQRWTRVGTVLQASANAFNPLLTLSQHALETVAAHRARRSRRAVRADYAEQCRAVGLPADVIDRYPHQLSGGMRQRAAIALALLGEPQLLIADEPTSGVDVVIQHHLLSTLAHIQRDMGLTVLLAAHDLAAVAAIADEVAVLGDGRVVERGAMADVLQAPEHPATQALVAAARSAATPPRQRHDTVAASRPGRSVLEVVSVTRRFARPRQGWRAVPPLHAVDDVSLTLESGACLAVVGESGGGKTTLGRLIAGLEVADAGSVRHLEARGDGDASRGRMRRHRRLGSVQMVFQDPFGALDPRQRVIDAVVEPLHVRRSGELQDRQARAHAMLVRVGLNPSLADRWPHQLSGGQRQRVAIARALIADPAVVVADEPTSMLDAPASLEIIDLLGALARDHGLAVLLITHDLALARRICDRIAVLDAGRIVELAPADQLFSAPRHPATRTLLAALPTLGGRPSAHAD